MTYKEQYNDILANIEINDKKIDDLQKNEYVKRYYELLEENEELLYKKSQIYINLKKEEYDNCNHLWLSNYDGDTCLKCGLATESKRLLYYKSTYYISSLDNRIMCDYLKDKNISEYRRKGIKICTDYDVDFVEAMYNKIKETYPNIEDEKMVLYIKSALHNMKVKDISEKRQENRLRRLKLK